MYREHITAWHAEALVGQYSTVRGVSGSMIPKLYRQPVSEYTTILSLPLSSAVCTPHNGYNILLYKDQIALI
jgi:hypothetical protein